MNTFKFFKIINIICIFILLNVVASAEVISDYEDRSFSPFNLKQDSSSSKTAILLRDYLEYHNKIKIIKGAPFGEEIVVLPWYASIIFSNSLLLKLHNKLDKEK